MKKILALLTLALLPTLVSAQAADQTLQQAANQPTPQAQASADAPYVFKRQGIFDCGGAPQRGVTSPGGGAYVPVADYTVEQNTGFILNNTDIIVYKECVLRELVDREREAAMAAYGKRAVIAVERGRNGNPQYVVNIGQELLEGVSDPQELAFLQDEALWVVVHPSLRDIIKRSQAQYYEGETRAPQDTSLRCPYGYDRDLNNFQNGSDPFNFTDFLKGMQPQCNPVYADYWVGVVGTNRRARALDYQRTQWDWGNGYYSVTDQNPNPLLARTYTPSTNVQQSFQTLLDSPVRQLESANDVGQMISALYAGLTTQIISDSRGISGLTQAVGGRPSYLDQLTAESSQGVRNAATNVALQVLNAARQVEAAYFQAVNGVAQLLTNAINSLRSGENQCWEAIIPRVCDNNPLSVNNICNDAGGATYLIATSTEFSDPVIASRITPLSDVAKQNVQRSQRALTLLDGIIQGVTNTASLDAQRVALQQLDSLVAQKTLHNNQDLQAVTVQYTSAQSAMQTLLTDTVQAWRTSADPNVGWCNVDNSTVIQAWKTRWKR